MPIRVLHVDDDRSDRSLVQQALERLPGGFELVQARNRAEFDRLLGAGSFDIVLSDLSIEAAHDGLALLDTVVGLRLRIPVVIVTASGSEELAVEALKRGAADYVLKSPGGLTRLAPAISRALERERLERERDHAIDTLAAANLRQMAVIQLGRAALGGRSRGELLAEAARLIGTTLGTNLASVRALARSAEDPLHGSWGFTAPAEPGPLPPLGRPLLWDGRSAPPPALPPGALEAGARAAALLQIRGRDRGLGVVGALSRRPREWSPEEVGFLELVAAVLAAAIEREEAEDDAERFFDVAPLLLCVADLEGRFRRLNPAWPRILGHPIEELAGRHYMDFVHPDDRPASLAVSARRAAGQGAVAGFVNRFRCRDGSYRWLSWSNRADPVRQVLYAVAVDVTELKRVEQGLAEARELSDSIIEGLPGLFAMVDTGGQVLRFNQSVARVTGWTPDRLRHASLRELLAPEDGALAQEALAEVFRTGTSRARVRVGPAAVPHLAVGVRAEAGGEARCLVIAIDVSAQERAEQALRQSEDQLRQAQKLEAVGRLAGGVAHDFNNILGVITGYADLLAREVPATDPRRRRVDHIRQAADRAANLTRQLLAVSRKQVLQPRTLDLNGVVADMEKMLRRLIGEDLELVTRLADGLHPVLADSGQLEQVLLNLAVNARDAMPRGGRLTIETRNAGSERVLLQVEDTGHGMDEATRAHAFEPFFTTKDPAKGTGLGLATVYGIVQQSGGTIELESAPGAGATFRIYLPVAPAQPDRPEPASTPPAEGGHETLLLVEDEPALRALAEEVLTDAGYSVLAAADPQQALELARAHHGPIDLVVSDVVMPGLSGPAMVERLGAERGNLRVLYMSGYTEDVASRSELTASGAAILDKPFTMDALLSQVREALAR